MSKLSDFLSGSGSAPAPEPTTSSVPAVKSEPAEAPAQQPSKLKSFLTETTVPPVEPPKEEFVPPIPPEKPEQKPFALSPLQQMLGVSEADAKANIDLRARLDAMQQELLQQAEIDVGADANSLALIRGLRSGTAGLAGTFQGLKAIGYKMIGDEEGMIEAAKLAQKYAAEQQVLAPKYQKVEDLIAKGGIGDFVEFAGHALGEQLPNIATVVASGGMGSYVGKKVAQLQAAKIVDDIAARQLVQKFVERGTKAGAFFGAAGLETGATAQEQLTALGDVKPLVAIGAGLIKGALEIQTPLALAQRFGMGEKLASKFYTGLIDKMTSGGLVRRTLGGGLVAAGGEAATEGLQETVDNFARGFVDANYDALGLEAASRILNASFVGGLVGGGFGAGVSALAGRSRIPGKPVTAEEARDILRPNERFTRPGGFFYGDEDPIAHHEKTKGLIEFADGRNALLNSSPNQRIWQVDLDQIAEEDQTASFDSLPNDPSAETLRSKLSKQGGFQNEEELNDAALQLSDIISTRNKAEAIIRDNDVLVGGEKIKEAKRLLKKLAVEYYQMVFKGVRVAPQKGGGIYYAGKAPIPPTAVREVPSTDFIVNPDEMIFVNTKVPRGDGANGTKHYEGSIGEGSGTAWIAKSQLEPWQVTYAPEALPEKWTSDLENRVVYAPWVDEAEKPKLLEDLKQAINSSVDYRKTGGYLTAAEKGIRLTPTLVKPQGTRVYGQRVRVLDVDPRKLTAIPAHLAAATQIKIEDFHFGKNFFDTKFAETGYSTAKHRPGTVWVIGRENLVEEGTKRNFALVEKALNALMPLLGKDFKMILHVDSETGAHMYPGTEGVGLIHFGNESWGILSSKREAANALFHEFGHHLSFSLFNNSEAKTKSAIYTAWLHHLYQTEGMNTSEFTLDFTSAGDVERVAKLRWKEKEPVTKYFEQNKDFQYWYDFDEWMAEQAAKYFTTEGTIGYDRYVKNYFKNLFDKIIESLKRIGATFGINFEPVEAYRSWMDDIIARRSDPDAKPLTFVAMEYQESKSPEWTGLKSPLMQAGVPQQLAQQADKYAWYVRWGWNLLQLAQANLHIAELQSYVERVRSWHISKMGWISRADGRIREWRALGKEMGQRLSDFIWDVESMSYLKPKENARKPTLVELQTLAQKHQLNREALELYLKIEGDFNAVLDKMEQIWRADAVRSISDPVELMKAMATISNDMKTLRSKPYFPHARFGDWTVSVRDANGKLIEFRQFENKRAQEAAYVELNASYPSNFKVQMSKMPEDVRMFRGLPPQLLKQLVSKMPNLTAAQKDWLDVLSFDLSPANSFSKHMKKRKGTVGWSMDAQRAYANYFLHAGNHLARIEHGWALEQAIADVARTAGNMADSRKRVQIRDYLDRHYQYIMFPPNELHAIRGLAFSWYLGFAPDSALINLTQIPLVAWPYLSARFNTAKATSELTKATKDIRQMYWLDQSTLSQDEIDAISMGIQHGFLEESQATELAAVSEGNNMARMVPGSTVERGVATLGRWAAFMFQSVEKLNRRIVFRAAYRLGRDNALNPSPETLKYLNELTGKNTELYNGLLTSGWRPENAIGFLVGRDAVERTQFEYAQWARPEFMRGAKGTLFTFFMFTQNMLWFTRYSPGSARYLALLLFTAGFMGLPGAEDLASILKFTISKLTGKYFDPEVELRKLISELTDRPDLVMHGLGRESFGMTMVGEMMGIPIPGFDFASRVSMGRVVPGVQPAFKLGSDWNDRIAETAEDVVGPAWSIPSSVVEGIAGFDNNDFKTWERLLPRAFKNMMRSLRYASEGREHDASGAELYRFDIEDPLSRLEMGGVALGFNPTGLRGVWDRNASIIEGVKFWQGRRAIILDQYYMAKRARDREAVAEARKAVRQYNADVPNAKLRITLDSLRRSWTSREEARKKREEGKAQSDTYEPVAKDIRSAYPEVD